MPEVYETPDPVVVVDNNYSPPENIQKDNIITETGTKSIKDNITIFSSEDNPSSFYFPWARRKENSIQKYFRLRQEIEELGKEVQDESAKKCSKIPVTDLSLMISKLRQNLELFNPAQNFTVPLNEGIDVLIEDICQEKQNVKEPAREKHSLNVQEVELEKRLRSIEDKFGHPNLWKGQSLHDRLQRLEEIAEKLNPHYLESYFKKLKIMANDIEKNFTKTFNVEKISELKDLASKVEEVEAVSEAVPVLIDRYKDLCEIANRTSNISQTAETMDQEQSKMHETLEYQNEMLEKVIDIKMFILV
ncbi:hypothetical protein ROZALSC1DRAFT_31706 [Rozella allomycis CSF55]|uniref:Uncharacterized protein n=1 Tax=Rozella allomycis (strain CSF55) TaxID=988480 RepID=A0A4V1IYZ7_ROZAC|nr:hypothetical protein ROZALSC1DRAFT_31706 [Rozella allomycis CSF55]